MSTRARVTKVVSVIDEALRNASVEVRDRERVAVFPNQLVLHYGEREFVVTVIESRKSRLK